MPRLSSEQRTLRRTGIGSSEIGAVCGLDPWKTVHEVWMEKCNLLAEDTGEESLATRVGHLAEDLIAQLYAEETRSTLVDPGTLRHPEHPWCLATPDRLVEGKRVVEIKWVGWRVAPLWGEEEDAVPPYVRTQVEWEMLVAGLPEAHVAAIVGGDDFRIYTVRACVELQEQLLARGRAFWEEHVVTGTPPPVDGTNGAREVLEALWREHHPPLAPAPPEADAWIEQLIRAKDAARRAEEEEREAVNHLAEIIGDKDGIFHPRGKVTWKRSKSLGDRKRTFRFWPSKKAEEKAA